MKRAHHSGGASPYASTACEKEMRRIAAHIQWVGATAKESLGLNGCMPDPIRPVIRLREETPSLRARKRSFSGSRWLTAEQRNFMEPIRARSLTRSLLAPGNAVTIHLGNELGVQWPPTCEWGLSANDISAVLDGVGGIEAGWSSKMYRCDLRPGWHIPSHQRSSRETNTGRYYSHHAGG